MDYVFYVPVCFFKIIVFNPQIGITSSPYPDHPHHTPGNPLLFPV